MLPTTITLSPEDRTKLSTLFRTRGDAVAFAHLREEDPLDTLLWLSQPHIKPWHEAIQKAHRDHEQTETHLSLARALRDITRILDLEADSTLRIRAVNAIIKLANAIHRSRATTRATTRATDFASEGLGSPSLSAAKSVRTTNGEVDLSRATDFASESLRSPSTAVAKSVRTTRDSVDLRRAEINAEDAALRLKINLERRANHALSLEDATAPVGAKPIETQLATGPTIADIGPLGPIGPILPIRRTLTPTLSAAHRNGVHSVTARAGAPRPPPHRSRKNHR